MVTKRVAGKRSATKAPAKRTTRTSRTVRRDPQDGAKFEALRKYVRSKGMQFLDDPNITSVGIARNAQGALCLEFTVAERASTPETLEALGTQKIPESIQVAGEAIPTSVVQRSYKPAFEVVEVASKDPRKQRLDTLVPGISVSHPAGSAGTLGAIVYDLQTGAPCMLSNWHVLHGSQGELGDHIVQPGPFDDNRVEQNEAGVLLRSHLGAAGDCAIARIDGRAFDPNVYDLATPIRRVGRPALGDIVVKSGRTTGVTMGVIRRIDVVAKLHYPGVGSRSVGGFEIGPPKGASAAYEVSMGGDSGSAWLAAEKQGRRLVPTDVMLGLHFAGETEGMEDEHGLACYADAVLEKLEVRLEPPPLDLKPDEQARPGYDAQFLGPRVDPPTLPGRKAEDVVSLAGSSLLPYTHFSVCLSRSRRLAHFVAWMIDGEQLKAYGRKNLKFVFDRRIPESFQVGDALYASNKLDRGHIARRADLVWGPAAEAQRANADSFCFTNISPQHQAFNQSSLGGLWGKLEDAIFEDADVARLRVSVIGGPIFDDADPEYRDIQIPRSFFKLLAFMDGPSGRLQVRAYVLTQQNLMSDLEALELDPFRMYQVSVTELGKLAGLRFSAALKKADTFQPSPEREALGVRQVREIKSRADIVA